MTVTVSDPGVRTPPVLEVLQPLLTLNYRADGRRTSTRSSMTWKSVMFSVRRGTRST